MLCVLAAAVAAQDTPLAHKGRTYQPKPLKNAENHLRLPFLRPQRDWERIDIYIPKNAKGDKLPCVVAVYGGGYGDKVLPLKQVLPLLDRGYVLAVPDYALQIFGAVPLCSWDIANAVRWLRANAAKYRIDPERIGIIGWSAGGWIVQDLCYSDSARLIHLRAKRVGPARGTTGAEGLIPAIEPRPLYADQSTRVQAAVSDWGAGKLFDRRKNLPDPRLSPDDPPLLTCFEGDAREPIGSVAALRKIGVPAHAVFMNHGTHVPSHTQPCKTPRGAATTWGEAIYDFFDRYVKAPAQATAPELIPAGGYCARAVQVRMLSVHPTGAIHYTLDGSQPTAASPKYDGPLTVQPGRTLKAIAVRDGLKPSRVATAVFKKGPPRPRITTEQTVFKAQVGRPFEAQLRAEGPDGLKWILAGRIGEQYRSYNGQRFNPPRHIPWLTLDAATGKLSGTPRQTGVFPASMAAWAAVGKDLSHCRAAVADARRIIIVVEPVR